MENEVQSAEQWIFRFMCGFALASSLSIAIQNIFLVLALVALVYRLYVKHDDVKDALNIDKHLLYPFLALAGAVVLSSLFGPEPIWSLRVFSDYYGYRMAGLYIVLIAIREKERLLVLAKLMFLSLFINGGFCIFNWIAHGQRTGGLIFYMSFAGMLSMGIPVFFATGLFAKEKQRPIFIIGTMFLLIVAVANSTRGMWLSVLITITAVIILAVQGIKKKIIICSTLGIILLTGFAFIPGVQHRVNTITDNKYQSNSERLLLWTSACNMYKDNPVAGIGFGRFKKEYQGKYILPEAKERELGHAHSNVMQMVAECGTIGAVTFIFWWLSATWVGIKKWLKTRKLAWLLFFAIITGLLITGLTEYNFGNSQITKTFWFTLSSCLQWVRLGDK